MKNLLDFIKNEDFVDVYVVCETLRSRDQAWINTIMWLRGQNIAVHPLPRVGIYIQGGGRINFCTQTGYQSQEIWDKLPDKVFVEPGVYITAELDEMGNDLVILYDE